MFKASKAWGKAAGLGQTVNAVGNIYRGGLVSKWLSADVLTDAQIDENAKSKGLQYDGTGEDGLLAVEDEVTAVRPGKPEVGDSKTQAWLRTLSNETAQAVYNLMLTCFEESGRVERSYPKLLDLEVSELRSLVANSYNEERDGNWYLQWSKCQVLTTTEKGSSHPRWPVKLDSGPTSVGAKLKMLCKPEELATLLQLSYPRFQPHHIAFNSKPSRAEDPLPVGCGTGSSISHSCDIRGCFNPAHCISAKVHIDNMDRQRCPGVVLVIYGNLIVTEIPCQHGKQVEQVVGGGLEMSILGSCIGIRLHYLTRAESIEIRDKIECEDEEFSQNLKKI